MKLKSVLAKLRSIENTNENIAGALSNVERLETNEAFGDHSPNINHLNDVLDEATEHITKAIRSLRMAATYSRGVIHGPFDGQIKAYTIPWLEKFIRDTNQPGSIASLRGMAGPGNERGAKE